MAACGISSAAAAALIFLIIASQLLGNGNRVVAGQQLQEPMSSMPLGSSWPARNLSYLASPARVFCFGWLQFPINAASHNNFYVAVWYAGLDNAIVWAANRNSPASDNDTLELTANGNLVISSFDRNSTRPIWQTNTSSKGVSAIQILNSGNVVLLLNSSASNSSASTYAWESFSSPTDTLLPSQTFLVNQTLISRPTAYSSSLGYGNFKIYNIQGGQLPVMDYIDAASGKSIISPVRLPWPAVYYRVDAVNNRSGVAGQFMQSNGLFLVYNSSGDPVAQIIPSDYGIVAPSSDEPVIRRLTLDPDGNLRMYGWEYASGMWAVLSQANLKLCYSMAVFAVPVCGPNGVCVDSPPQAACGCPPGFHPTDLGDVSRGCGRDSNLPLPSCDNNSNVSTGSAITYVVLRNTNFYWNDMRYLRGIALASCQNLCTQECSCVAVIYDLSGSGMCWLKNKLTHGYSPQEEAGGRDSYIKIWINSNASRPVINPPNSHTLAWINSSVFWSQALQLEVQSNTSVPTTGPTSCSQPPAPPPEPPRSVLRVSTAVIIISAISSGELLCFLLAVFLLYKTNLCGLIRPHRQDQVSPAFMEHTGCRSFTYAEIVQATDNFSQPLGSGAFGEVVKGILPDGREIAVKTLQASALQGAGTHDQFKAEIATLGRIHHFNLVRLYGYCAEGPHRLLVYEFMENGSMNSFLFTEHDNGGVAAAGAGEEILRDQMSMRQGPPFTLSWRARYEICLGTAKGLAYLHEDCLDCIVHCDIKPENILLDREFRPKVGDFGVAYLFGRNETLETTTIRGTRGYLAPEWLAYMPITAKADVFSYGMLLIEIVSGRRNFRFAQDGTVIMSPAWAFRQVQSGRLLEAVVDARIREEVNCAEVEKVLRIAFLCLHKEARARPTMKGIVQMLEDSAVELPMLPQGPGSFYEQVEAGVDYNVVQGPHFMNTTSTATHTTSVRTSSSSNLLSPR
ncbi:hypothetical protein GOP47_0018301 [Adiantum capillus-veneris]|uniref:non-specific serine/threonine protein kinase n=1 Tax=Adiantum capillus-veneris TaxID=13818 RepID=A0A9D4UI02_ADICA|nr:hypothetical protein GOP47_0018301 [Adiantum capillus-veneris]